MKICISNPPFNLKWEYPIFAQLQNRFQETELPPLNNANFAFILTALDQCEKAVFILPTKILTTTMEKEYKIKKYLIEKNYIESVIMCPEKMFESTSIAVCIIVFNKKKDTSKIVMIDASDFCEKQIREQKGQFGGQAHENRIYKKEVNIFNDSQIAELKEIVKTKKEKEKLSKIVTLEEIKQNDYILLPSRYFDINDVDNQKNTRSYEDIINDINRIIKQKNCLKLTINEKIAKSIGMYELINNMKESEKTNAEIYENIKNIKNIDVEIEKENFITLSKSKNEIKFENNSKEQISEILLLIMNNWKVLMYHLNNEENRYLIELRDKLLPDLMSGKIDLSNI